MLLLAESEINQFRVTESYFTINGAHPAGSDAPLTGFRVEGDPVYTMFNDFDVALGVRGLQFLVNVSRISDELMVPGELLGFGAPLPDFVLQPFSSMAFNIAGNLDPGKYLYAQSTIFDAGFTEEIGSSIDIHQSPVPEPTAVILFGTGLAGVAVRLRPRRRQHK